MLKLINSFRRFARQIFHRVRITKPIGSLDGIIHVPLPMIWAHIRKRGRDPALRRNRMRAGWKHFGDAGGAQPLLCHAQSCPQASATSADYNNIIFMGFKRIF